MFLSKSSWDQGQGGKQDWEEGEVVIPTKVSAPPMGTPIAGMTSRWFPIRARWPEHPYPYWKEV